MVSSIGRGLYDLCGCTGYYMEWYWVIVVQVYLILKLGRKHYFQNISLVNSQKTHAERICSFFKYLLYQACTGIGASQI